MADNGCHHVAACTSESRGPWPGNLAGAGMCGLQAGNLAGSRGKQRREGGRKELGQGLGFGPRPIEEIEGVFNFLSFIDCKFI
jgi:hypothetical protein